MKIGVATFLVVAVALAGCAQPASISAARPAAAGETREFDLYAMEGVPFSPIEGRSFLAFAFSLSPNGPFTIPGPEIRVREGDHVVVRFHDTGVGHTVHWHGYSLPWAMDGVPYMTQTIQSNGVPSIYTYEFDALESGTYWYHCHVDAPTHVDAGLFGAFIVEPRDPGYDPPFDREATLILHELDSQMFLLADAAFGTPPSPSSLPPNPFDAVEGAENGARTLVDLAGFITGPETGEDLFTAGPRDYYPEYSLRYRPKYDTFMINGKAFPETEPMFVKTDETLRIRLVNAGQLLHTIHLHGHHFLVTHKDGYKLASPFYADSQVIGPGERYDLYVKANNPGMWDVHDHGGAWDVGAYAANDHAFPGGMNTMLVYEDFDMVDLPNPLPDEAGAYMAFAPSFGGRHARHEPEPRPAFDPAAPAANTYR